MKLTRRQFLEITGVGTAVMGLSSIGLNRGPVIAKIGEWVSSKKKVIVLGFDGMDFNIVAQMMERGKLPNFKRLAHIGDFKKLTTSIPPQSPVAWSNFITGTNPGGHGIFDFIHRNPKTYLPYLSTSKVKKAKHQVTIGNIVIPLESGKVSLLRKGKAFWEILEEYGIPSTVFKIPANFPPAKTKQRTFSGMGTPDILGTYGMFSFYTEKPIKLKEDISGGRICQVKVRNNTIKAQLIGPKNPFRKDGAESIIDFIVRIDPENPVAKIIIQDNEILLKQGEWSDWITVKFQMIPTQSVTGICQFYMKMVHPEFKLYVTPINITPSDPIFPISTPKGYAEELYDKFGPFCTKGLPADTKALEHGVLDEEEFLHQDDIILKERLKIFEYELNRHEDGLLFYYFSNPDQRTHMFWRLRDKSHPAYNNRLALQFAEVVENIYIEMDKVLGRTLEKTDSKTTIIVMSDHGFAPYARSFHLNTWLKNNGYITLKDEKKQGKEEFFMNVKWDETVAYALGLNGLYINLRGREGRGIVWPGSEQSRYIDEIAEKLEHLRDPKTGNKVILKAYKTSEVYSGNYVKDAPDIIVGYNSGFRASWQTALGKIPKVLFEDNTDKWSSDHCMAHTVVPGILLANKKIVVENPAIFDITATILSEFGIEKGKDMVGKTIF
jgi:predicted AlkP superfamily phosphohydrolase/phosphomutase